ncbi:MAG: STAS domain-containing protein [Planctomycetes bacterium]|nr:STAS domain-containing protein [Planctomycetota bacterium]
MVQIAAGWSFDVDRGPDWVFVKLHEDDSTSMPQPPLADTLLEVLRRHFAHRLVLELDEITLLRSFVLGQLLMLQKEVQTQGGIMRLCGLSEENQRVLHAMRLDGRLPNYQDRVEAVLGRHWPKQPR